MRKFLGIAAVSAAAIIVAPAQAATYFDLSSGAHIVSSNSSGYVLESDGITLSLTAGLRSGSGVVPGAQDARPYIYSGHGAGISDWYDQEHTVDGKDDDDVLIFSFSEDVTFDWARFSYVDHHYEQFDFYADTNDDGMLERVVSSIDLDYNGWLSMASVWTTAGKLFGIGAHDKYDSFKVKGLKVTYVPPAEVPLPAALPLFLAGIAGLGVARRRKAVRA